MGCDIHIFYEKKVDGKWVEAEDVRAVSEYDYGDPFGITEYMPFDWRQYSMFAWLCSGVRDYCGNPSISRERGLPDDISESAKKSYEDWACDAHSASFLSVDEISSYIFDGYLLNREGEMVTAKELFGDDFFASIEELKRSDCERIVFWFDN